MLATKFKLGEILARPSTTTASSGLGNHLTFLHRDHNNFYELKRTRIV
jgi:hypothetical protein